MSLQIPAHLAEKFMVYAIYFDDSFSKRPTGNILLVHIGRPVSLGTLCEAYIFQHPELTVETTGEKIKTNEINGIQKVANTNKPKYELTMAGVLKEV